MPPADKTSAAKSREALELALRSEFDPDDALSAAQIVVGEGWRPPDEVKSLRDCLEEAVDWLDNDLAHAPDTTTSMADRDLVRHWRAALEAYDHA